MKKYTTILLLVLVTTIALAQKKEKVKGSKTVTTELKEVERFNALEVADNLEVSLERGEKNELKIEADDNLHEIISVDVRDNILRIFTSKEAVNYKKLMVRITYTKDFNSVTAKDNTVINAIQELQLNDITFKTQNYSQLYLNVNAKILFYNLMTNQK